ncbi:MAG: VOC family protein [Myxococcota bacterium]
MTKVTFWNTLAVQDLERARAFYTALGFTVQDTPIPGGITVQPNGSVLLCLFVPQAFGGMIPGEICDAHRSQEVVQSISVDTKEAVDALAAKAKEAGGRPIGEPKEQPYGYGCGFADPDGHVWAVLWFASGP